MRPGDTTNLTDAIVNDFIALAEADIFERLDLTEVETHDPAFAVSAEYTALPDGFRGFRRAPRVNGATANRLILASPSQIDDETDPNSTDDPRLYCIEGNELRLGPIPANAITLNMTYFGRPAAIADNSTNVVLTTYPNIYLYGSLSKSAPYIGEDGRMPLWKSEYDSGCALANSTARKKRWSGLGEMRLVGATP